MLLSDNDIQQVMNKTRRVIAISPIPEQVLLAADCRSDWDELVVAGAGRLLTVIQQLHTDNDCSHLMILVPNVRDAGAIHRELQALADAGTEVTWFAPKASRSVADACRGFAGVELVTGPTLEHAVAVKYPARRVQKGGAACRTAGRVDLLDWSQYKCYLCLMKNLDPAPLVEAADYLASSGSLKPPLDDEASVQRFKDSDFPQLEGWSGPLGDLKERILQVGPADIRALIIGETGTGKEAVAFYLHEFSARRPKQFVALNCAGLDENLLRSELFGHEKGAFTGAISQTDGLVKQADCGTLFLDELGDMPLAVQADLLRFIQTGRFRRVGGKTEESVNIRIVAAAQPDIHERIKDGRFRPDLYYRIAEVELRTPALREIPGDIQAVIKHLTFRFAGTSIDRNVLKKHLDYFEAGHDLLSSQDWPGNVRELAAMVKRRVLLDDDVLADLKKKNPAPTVTVPGKRAEIRPIDDVIREYVKGVMDNRGPLTQQEVAERLGRSVNTLKKLLAE